MCIGDAAVAANPVSSPMHADPRDAVNIFIDTRCRKALGMHWVCPSFSFPFIPSLCFCVSKPGVTGLGV